MTLRELAEGGSWRQLAALAEGCYTGGRLGEGMARHLDLQGESSDAFPMVLPCLADTGFFQSISILDLIIIILLNRETSECLGGGTAQASAPQA